MYSANYFLINKIRLSRSDRRATPVGRRLPGQSSHAGHSDIWVDVVNATTGAPNDQEQVGSIGCRIAERVDQVPHPAVHHVMVINHEHPELEARGL